MMLRTSEVACCEARYPVKFPCKQQSIHHQGGDQLLSWKSMPLCGLYDDPGRRVLIAWKQSRAMFKLGHHSPDMPNHPAIQIQARVHNSTCFAPEEISDNALIAGWPTYQSPDAWRIIIAIPLFATLL